MTKYKVTKTYDYAPTRNCVQEIKAGTERDDLTRGAIEKGKKLGALEEVKDKPPAQPKK